MKDFLVFILIKMLTYFPPLFVHLKEIVLKACCIKQALIKTFFIRINGWCEKKPQKTIATMSGIDLELICHLKALYSSSPFRA